MLVNASSIFGNIDLAKKAHQLAIQISSLSKAEDVDLCKDKTHWAASNTEWSAEYFMTENYFSAKYFLKNAINALAYTVIEDCTQASNILIAKNELTKLYDSVA
jgi:archaellin